VRCLLVIALVAGCGRFGFRDAPDAAVDAPPDIAVDAAACGPGYDKQLGGLSRYRLAGPDTWDHAERACEADGYGAHLIVFDDVVEMQMSETFENTAFWIGLSDRIVDNTFLRVIGGVATFTPSWTAGAPSLAGPGCVAFNPPSRTIQDAPCSVVASYVCECDGRPAQPGSY
jgi:predicted small lipoprotein YifL